jgi:hypothetical protein
MKRTPEQIAFWEAFRRLPFVEQLRQFLDDIEHPPQYYPQWFAFRIKEQMLEIPPSARLGVLWRVRGRRKEPWNSLKRRIAQLHCRRIGREYEWPWVW